MFKKMVSVALSIVLLATSMSLGDVFGANVATAATVSAGSSFTYTQADHWGVQNNIWSWQWASADSNTFSDMTFTTVEGQGECYVADWQTYPNCAAHKGGNNVMPNANADAARVFTAPESGQVTVFITVARTADFTMSEGGRTPTSFRILLGNTTVYPTEGEYRILNSSKSETITLNLKVLAGEKLRFVVGAIGDHESDDISLGTTVTYTSVSNPGTQRVGQSYTFSATSATWGKPDSIWSWEYTPSNQTDFAPMTYQLNSAYGYNMYVADWAKYPYSYVDNLGVKVHPAAAADTVKTFTAPYTGTIKVDTSVNRQTKYDAANSWETPSSLRILLNDTQVYPLYSDRLTITDTQVKKFAISVQVRQGDKLRFVVGSMGAEGRDAVSMYNTVSYTSLEESPIVPGQSYTHKATSSNWGTDISQWRWEWRDQDNTFGSMLYQNIADYGNVYASDWKLHTYGYVTDLGKKIQPAKTRDTVKTFIAPYSGRVSMQINVKREKEHHASAGTPTSLRVFLNDKQIWPTDGSHITLSSTTAQTFTVDADVVVGDKLRCVVGSMDDAENDMVQLDNTVTYRAVGAQELAVVTDQRNAALRVYDVSADNWEQSEIVWNWSPTTELGFSLGSTFGNVSDAKLRYSPSLMKHVVAVCSSKGFLGVADYATGKKIWEVDASVAANPHAIEYLPNGNVAAAASQGGWVRVYAASQNSTDFAKAFLAGAHGVVWDAKRNVLWAVGNDVLTAFRIGGTDAAPTLKEAAADYRVHLPSDGGHDLSPVQGNPDRLWVSTNSGVYQYDIETETFHTDYAAVLTMNHTGCKGISNYRESDTVVNVFPNGAQPGGWNSDRVYVSFTENGKSFGRTHIHSTASFYKVRSWIADYNDYTPSYTVTFNPAKGACPAATKMVTPGGKYGTLPTPTRNGYTFDGWYTADNKLISARTTVAINGDHTLTARWIEIGVTYTVTFDAAGGTCDTKNKTVTSGNEYGALPTPTKKGQLFEGWYTADGTRVTDKTKVAATKDHTLTARWVEEGTSCTVTFDAAGGIGDTADKKVSFGGKYGTLPTPTKEGYTFDGWYTADGTRVTGETKVAIADDHTLTARWIQSGVTCTVTFDTAGGTCDTKNKTVTSGNEYGALPTPTKEGYIFEGWYTENGTCVTAKSKVAIAEDHTLTARWTESTSVGGHTASGRILLIIAFVCLGLLILLLLFLFRKKILQGAQRLIGKKEDTP